jgi:aspartate/methionine/tyrosine aminotransferase
MTPDMLLSRLTRPAQTEPDSGIVNVAMYGMGRPGMIAFWAGEGNLPTPREFCEPAVESLLKGETFYTWQRGIPELRQSLADYHTRHYGRDLQQRELLRHRRRHAGHPERHPDGGG